MTKSYHDCHLSEAGVSNFELEWRMGGVVALFIRKMFTNNFQLEIAKK